MDDETTRTLTRAAAAGDAAAVDKLGGGPWMILERAAHQVPHPAAEKVTVGSHDVAKFAAWGVRFSDFGELLAFVRRNAPEVRWDVLYEPSNTGVGLQLAQVDVNPATGAIVGSKFAADVPETHGHVFAAPGWSLSVETYAAVPFPHQMTFSGPEAIMIDLVRDGFSQSEAQLRERYRGSVIPEKDRVAVIEPLLMALGMLYVKHGHPPTPPCTSFDIGYRNPATGVLPVTASGPWVAGEGCTGSDFT